MTAKQKKEKRKKMYQKKKCQPVSSGSNTSHLKNMFILPSTPLCKACSFKKMGSCLTEERMPGWQPLQPACWLLLLWLLSLPACFTLPTAQPAQPGSRPGGYASSPQPGAPPRTAPRSPTAPSAPARASAPRGRGTQHTSGAANPL